MGEFKSEFYGGLGFIIGSLCFIFACFLNGMHTGIAFIIPDDYAKENPELRFKILLAKVLVIATTSSTMLGSLLFLVGSVLYLPVVGCGRMTTVIGTWNYLIGSVFFMLAGVFPVVRRKYANIDSLVVDIDDADIEITIDDKMAPKDVELMDVGFVTNDSEQKKE